MRRKQIGAWCLALLAALSLAACGGEAEAEPGRTGGLFYEASGVSPDAVLLTVDGRAVPAWRYLYWLTWGCDQLHQAYADAGLALDWSETVEGAPLSAYVRDQALENTVLYATVENWADAQRLAVTEEDRPTLDALWTQRAQDAGGEDVYLTLLAARGLDRADEEALLGDALLYRKLCQLSGQAGSALAPAEGELERFAQERGYLTVESLTVPVAAGGDRESCRQQAASLFAQLNASGDPAAAFVALAATYGGPGGTFCPGGGVLPEPVEQAAQALEAGQWSGILESDDGFYILLRRPLDTAAVAPDYFDHRLQQAAEAAAVERTEAYEALEAPAFYERLTAARAAETPS